MPGFKPITRDELHAIQDALSGPWAARERAFFALVYHSGLRPRDARRLAFADVYRFPRGVVDRIAASDHPRDDQLRAWLGDRQVILGEAARAALAAWLDVAREALLYHPARPLFLDPGHRDRAITLDHLSRLFGAAAAKAGLQGRLSLHSLRKGWLLDYAARTNYAFRKVRAAGSGYSSPRKARRAFLRASEALATMNPAFGGPEEGVQRQAGPPQSEVSAAAPLEPTGFRHLRYVRRR
jgi:integrase